MTKEEYLQRQELYTQVENLRVFVWACEDDWRLLDRLDLAASWEH
jgi:hypothetical protein